MGLKVAKTKAAPQERRGVAFFILGFKKFYKINKYL